MMEDVKKSTSYIPKYDAEKDEFYYQVTETIKEFDMTSRRWRKVSEKELEPISMIERDSLTKQASVRMIFVRNTVNPYTLLPLKGYFVRRVTFRIIKDKVHRHKWLRLLSVKHGKKKVQLCVAYIDLVSGIQQILTFSKRNQFEGLAMRFGKARRISIEEARRLLKEENCVKEIYEEISEDEPLRLTVYRARR